MTRIKSTIVVIAFAFFAAACAKEHQRDGKTSVSRVPTTFSVSSEVTKTAVSEKETSVDVIWTETDDISIFDGAGDNVRFTLKEGTASGSTAVFEGEATPASRYYAVYPYNASSAINGTTVTTTVPSLQLLDNPGFASGSNITVACSNGNGGLLMKNVLSLVKITLSNQLTSGAYSRIRSIKVEAKDGSPVAGEFTVDCSGDAPVFAAPTENAQKSVTIRREDNGDMTPGNYYIPIFPGKRGVKVTITNTQGAILVRESGLELEFDPSVVNSIGEIRSTKYIADHGTVTDIDGNVYETVQFGEHLWMRDNLRATRYSDGTPIPQTVAGTPTTNDASYFNPFESAEDTEKYGLLYTWAVTQGKNPCPEGWHVPSYEEYTALEHAIAIKDSDNDIDNKPTTGTTMYRGATDKLGYWMKSGEFGGFANSEFNALPTGSYYTSYAKGPDAEDEKICCFWTTEAFNATKSFARMLSSKTSKNACGSRIINNYYAYSIRCVKSAPVEDISSTLELSVTTFNVRKNSDDCPWDGRKDAVLANISGKYHNPEIICMQECSENPVKSSVTEMLSSAYSYHDINVSEADPALIFWKKDKFDKEEGGYVDMLDGNPSYTREQYKGSRYASYVVLKDKQDGRKVLVYNIHLKTNVDETSYQQLRVDCVNGLCPVAKAKSVALGNIPVIIGGDFNNYKKTEEEGIPSAPKVCETCGFTDAYDACPKHVNYSFSSIVADMTTGQLSLGGPEKRLDFIYLFNPAGIKGVRYQNVVNLVPDSKDYAVLPLPSDHLPVNAVIRFAY